MEIMLIILFFILILICTSKIEIHIENLETVKSKIKFLIRIKFYIFKHILIFSKKIKKKDILKFIDFSDEKHIIIKESKIIKKVPIELISLELSLSYGLKHLYTNVYIYAILNALIPMLLYKYSKPYTQVNYNINTNFKTTQFYVKLSAKLRIRAIEIIRQGLKTTLDPEKSNCKVHTKSKKENIKN